MHPSSPSSPSSTLTQRAEGGTGDRLSSPPISIDDVRDIVRRYAGDTVADDDVQDIHLYRLALTHYSAQRIPHNGERLEFLGDAVLGAVAAEYVYIRYKAADEGFLSRMRVQLVCGATLARLCSRLPIIWRAIVMSVTAEAEGMRANPAVREDALEAFIGAIYMDRGGFRAARAWLIGLFEAEVDFAAAVLLATTTTTTTAACAATTTVAPVKPKRGPGGACGELMRRCDDKAVFSVCNVTHVPSESGQMSGRGTGKLYVVAAMIPQLPGSTGDDLVEVGRGTALTLTEAKSAAARDAMLRMDATDAGVTGISSSS